MGFRFDIGDLEPSFSDVASQPKHDLFSKGAPFDDVGAFVYYAGFGALDPKAVVFEIPLTMRYTGLGFIAAYFRQLPPAMLVSGILGWAWDPMDRREGGWAEMPDEPPSSDSYWDRGFDDPYSTW